MGIVQKLRKKNENLEAKNRMLKRMYETQKAAAAKAMIAENGAEQVVKYAALQLGGRILIPREKLEEMKNLVMVGKFSNDALEYVLQGFLTEEELKELNEAE